MARLPGRIDFTFEYKQGRMFRMVNALSRKAELASLSRPEGVLLELIKKGLKNDPVALGLIRCSKGQDQIVLL